MRSLQPLPRDMPPPCAQCDGPGPSCGVLVPEDALPRPCVRCAYATRVRAACGAARHYHCDHAPAPAPVIVPPERVAPAAAPAHRWLAGAGRAAQVDNDQPALRIALGELAPTLDAAGHGRAIRLWNLHLRGITYQGGHRTALGILNGTLRHRSIPELPEAHPDELAAPGDGPVWAARSWLVDGDPGQAERLTYAAAAGMHHLAAYDVNGAYLSAAAIDLGIGPPEHTDAPDDTIVRRPGWVRVDDMEGAPHGIGQRWQAGMWMRTELARYLVDAGATLLISEAVTQRAARRWLDPHVDLMRDARRALIAENTPAARAVLAVLKDVYTRMFGGLLESTDHNRTRTLRPWWRAAIMATAQARMFRSLDTAVRAAPTSSATLIGLHVDAAWLVLPRQFTAPTGLTIDPGQLGKWKAAGRVPWTPELASAYRTGQPNTLRVALHDAPAESSE